jgi:hypothetical protein
VQVQFGEDSAYKEAKWNLKSTVSQWMNRRTVKETGGKVMGEIQHNGGTKMKTKLNTMININYYKITNGR